MPTITLSKVTDGRALRGRWERLVEGLLPAPDADRLVRVAELSRTAVPFAEDSLGDADIAALIQETRSLGGDTRFAVLVPARSAAVAKEVLAGL